MRGASAARELFAYLVQTDGGRRVLPNVGAIVRASIPASAIDSDSRLVTYRERLREIREHAAASRQSPPGRIPLLAAGDLAAIKPLLAVRTPAAFRSAVLLWGVFYILAFHAVSLIWRWRAVRGDRVLLTAAHL